MAAPSLNLPYLLLTGVVVIALAMIFLVVRPLLADISLTRDQIVAVSAQRDAQREFLRTVDRKRQQLQQEEQRERQVAVVLPADDALADATRVLDRAAGSAGLTVMGVRNETSSVQRAVKAAKSRGQARETGGQPLPEGVAPLAMSVKLRGTYPQARLFFEQVERSVRLMDIQAIQLKSTPNQPEVLDGEILVWFYRHEPAQP